MSCAFCSLPSAIGDESAMLIVQHANVFDLSISVKVAT